MTIYSVVPPFLKQQATQSVSVLPPWVNAQAILAPGPQPWTQQQVVHLRTERLTVAGAQRFRKHAELRVRVFLPLREGDQASLAVSSTFRKAFREVTIDGNHYGRPRVTTYGRQAIPGNGAWWRLDLVAPFYSDDSLVPNRNGASYAEETEETAHNICRQRFNVEVQVPLGLTVVYDNTAAVDADGGTGSQPEPGAEWVRFSVTLGEPFRTETGIDGLHRTTGIAIAQHFAPLHEGDAAGWSFADSMVGRFRSVRDRGVVFATPSVVSVGRQGPWWQTNVQVPFTFDERY